MLKTGFDENKNTMKLEAKQLVTYRQSVEP